MYNGEYFWTLIINVFFSVSISASLHSVSDEILSAIILGRSCRCAGIDNTGRSRTFRFLWQGLANSS